MPELPEVQTVVDDLIGAGMVGRKISAARVFWPRTVECPSSQKFCRTIAGLKIETIRRRGKYIIFDFKGGEHLLIHLRMSGRLLLSDASKVRKAHEHVILSLGKTRQLRFYDPRKFGRFSLMRNPEAVLDRLGPEPLAASFTLRRLEKQFESRRRILKPLLLDQRFIAGLGNIYVDEALWAARIHPRRRSDTLCTLEKRALHRAIRLVLRRGLKNLGTTLGTGKANFYSVSRRKGRNQDQLYVFRRTGEACHRCKTTIERIIVGQRSTHICPRCQKQPDPAK